MQALKRRAEQLAKILDAQRRATGEPSILDLRPDHGGFVSWLLQSFHDLVSVDSWAGRAEIPYERLTVFLDREGLPEAARPLFRQLVARWNKWRDDRRENEK